MLPVILLYLCEDNRDVIRRFGNQYFGQNVIEDYLMERQFLWQILKFSDVWQHNTK